MAAQPQSYDAAEMLATAAAEMHNAQDLDEALQRIVDAARNSLDGIDHIGVSLVEPKGAILTKASTGDLVLELDALQYTLREGPCVDAILPGAPTSVVVNELRHEQRWPNYVPRAVALGLKAQMGIQLYSDGRAQGGLNLYSTQAEHIEPDVQHLAQLFATHAAIALGHARREHNLSEAIKTRTVIGQATGIVMERFGVSSDRAFIYLTRISQTKNLKLREVADQLCRQTNS